MKATLLILLLCGLGVSGLQSDLWSNVSVALDRPQIQSAAISQGQLARLRKALLERVKPDRWCDDGEDPDWVDRITFGRLPVSDDVETVLVEAGVGCARGGQGANGAMWVVRFEGDKVIFLATPEHKFSGWLYSIEASTSHGFKDVVLGWHMRAMEADLSYFKFDGASYRLIGTAQLITDEDGKVRIVPGIVGSPSGSP
jgi:hypothetical protein